MNIENKRQKTEFGDFVVIDNGDYFDLFLEYKSKSLHLGWVRILDSVEASILKQQIMDRLVILFLIILRSEVKLAMFGQIPLTNKFKDAVLRMQIENSGQTFEIQKFVDKYDKIYSWRTYEEIAKIYSIDEFRSSDLVLRSPYGRYVFVADDEKRFHMTVTRNDTDHVLSDIYIPYFQESDSDKKIAAILQGIDNISNDINDIVHQKKMEMVKRIAETIKYIFGYDKLRRALRNRAME